MTHFVCGLGFDQMGDYRALFSDNGALMVRLRETNQLLPFASYCKEQPRQILARWHDWLVANLAWHHRFGSNSKAEMRDKVTNVEKAVISLSIVLKVMDRGAA